MENIKNFCFLKDTNKIKLHQFGTLNDLLDDYIKEGINCIVDKGTQDVIAYYEPHFVSIEVVPPMTSLKGSFVKYKIKHEFRHEVSFYIGYVEMEIETDTEQITNMRKGNIIKKEKNITDNDE